MRRDYVTLHIDGGDDGDLPAVVLAYDGPAELLRDRLESVDGEVPTAGDIDVAYRLQTPVDADEPTGVFSLTDRLTGEYILETNVDAAPIRDLVGAARDDSDANGSYRVELREDGESWTFEKETLLIYDRDGSLLRQHSLIPSGVEL